MLLMMMIDDDDRLRHKPGRRLPVLRRRLEGSRGAQPFEGRGGNDSRGMYGFVLV